MLLSVWSTFLLLWCTIIYAQESDVISSFIVPVDFLSQHLSGYEREPRH